MNTKRIDDAFPTTEYYDEKPIGCTEGLTKREYFAALAMQGLLANSSFLVDALVAQVETGISVHKITANGSVLAADALIEALNKSHE